MTGQQPLILIVDDEPDFREIFGTKLTSAGFRVDTAENAEVGVKKVKELKPDLILMDVKMPGTTGADAVLRLRENPETKNVKVVFLTNLGDPREEARELSKKYSVEFGAQGFIKKTEDLDAVVDQVRKFLQ